jgi:hypothetical protein
LSKQPEKTLHHNFTMTKSVGVGSRKKCSENNPNKGFIADKNCHNFEELEGGESTMKKKTKGISYAKNAQELKRLI